MKINLLKVVEKIRQKAKKNELENGIKSESVQCPVIQPENVQPEKKKEVKAEIKNDEEATSANIPTNQEMCIENNRKNALENVIKPDIVQNEKSTEKHNDLCFDEVVQQYLTTDHWGLPQNESNRGKYDFRDEYHRAAFDCILNNIPKCDFELGLEEVLRNDEKLTPYKQSETIDRWTERDEVANFIAIDTETTGLTASDNDIIEVTAIKFKNFVPVSVFTTLLKPQNPIPERASIINGITDEMVQSAPTFAQIKSALEDFIGDYPIVAHNAEFDVKFLHVSGLKFSKSVTFFDTLELSRKYIRVMVLGTPLKNYKLATVCEECNIIFDGAHRSMADALAAGLLFIEIIKRLFKTYNIFTVKFDGTPPMTTGQLYGWGYYQTEKPIKTFTATIKSEIGGCATVGDEVEQGYDMEKDKETLDISSGDSCTMPKRIREFFQENYEDYRMFVMETEEIDFERMKIQVGIYKA